MKQFDTTQVCYLRVSFIITIIRIITIICPLGYIVFDIFGDFVAVMVAAYYMVMIAVLPIEFDIIATCESSDSRFYCHDNRRQPRTMMRNQRRVATCETADFMPVFLDLSRLVLIFLAFFVRF